MCYSCWEDEGKPQIDTPAVRQAALAVERLHDHPAGCAGGAMHVVTDDWNIDDDSVGFCRDHIGRYEREHPHRADGLTALEQACYDAFAALTVAERSSALALDHGFWGDGEVR